MQKKENNVQKRAKKKPGTRPKKETKKLEISSKNIKEQEKKLRKRSHQSFLSHLPS